MFSVGWCLWEAVAPLLSEKGATGQALPDIQAEAHEYRGAGIVSDSSIQD